LVVNWILAILTVPGALFVMLVGFAIPLAAFALFSIDVVVLYLSFKS